ncbi:MAG: DUF4389 domain-containing protein [Ignavibacteriales bacterium]|nr:DUF4389 domain-containing protein [Ignavibacteriales bacterium]
MTFNIQHQEKYSRGELLLRTFFGWLYIGIPHGFLLGFVGIWSAILTFIAFWSILFTGRYPQSFYEFQVKYLRWYTRVYATMMNFIDGYPAFGTSVPNDEKVQVEIQYPEKLGRGLVLLKIFFGWLYCAFPHVIIWYFRMLASFFLMFIAWWIVLFTGNYPANSHKFNVGTMRWMFRVYLYLYLMTDEYPPFSGKTDDELNAPVS